MAQDLALDQNNHSHIPAHIHLTGSREAKNFEANICRSLLLEVEIKDTDLLHTVNTLLNEETGKEENPWSEEVQTMKILSALSLATSSNPDTDTARRCLYPFFVVCLFKKDLVST